LTVAAFLIFQFTQQKQSVNEIAHVDWRLVPAALLILFALWILAALALACSTRFDMIPTLTICSALFLVGLMSDYLFGRPAERGVWWGSVLYTLIPNWQNFWLADALDSGRSTFHWGYVGKAFAYLVCYVGAALAVAVTLFEDRELVESVKRSDRWWSIRPIQRFDKDRTHGTQHSTKWSGKPARTADSGRGVLRTRTIRECSRRQVTAYFSR
jgi:hypothetical protein